MRSSLRFLLLALSLLHVGAAPAQEVDAQKLPARELTPQILYQSILAEIAVARGKLPLAASLYADLAKSTRDPRLARRAAEIAFHAKLGPAAIGAARLWLELEPESAQARQYLWSLLATSGRNDELAEALTEAVKAEANTGAALLQLNRLLVGGKDRQAVMHIVDKVTAPYLSLPEARFARAQAAASAREELRAMAEIDELLKLKPDWPPAILVKAQLLARSPEKALEVLDGYLQRQAASPSGDIRLARARLLVELRRFTEARDAFAALLKEQPDNPDIIYALGLLSMQLDDDVAAEAHLRRLLAMGYAEDDSVRFYLGQLVADGGRIDDALELYDGIPEKSSRYAPAQAKAAELLRNSGRLDDALAKLRNAAAASAEMRSALVVAQGQLLAEAGREQEGLDLLSRALAAHPDDPMLLYEVGMMEERAQRYEAMEGHLRRLIKLKPDHAQAYNALGYSFVDRNLRMGEARQLIDKAMALTPDDPFILDSKGWLHFRLGESDKAEPYLRQAYRLRPDPEIAAHLGEVLWTLDRRDEARSLWDAATRAAPTNAVLSSTIKRFIP